MDRKNKLNYLTDNAAKHVIDVHVHHQAPEAGQPNLELCCKHSSGCVHHCPYLPDRYAISATNRRPITR